MEGVNNRSEQIERKKPLQSTVEVVAGEKELLPMFLLLRVKKGSTFTNIYRVRKFIEVYNKDLWGGIARRGSADNGDEPDKSLSAYSSTLAAG